MSFFTGKGDDGTTGLLGKDRVAKYDARIETVGTLDEASSALGLARSLTQQPRSRELLLEAQRDLYQLMAEVASLPENADHFRFDSARVAWVESQIASLGETVKMPGEFIVPGDSPAEGALSVARSVVRRAERRLVELFDLHKTTNPALQQYANRLSSLLFALQLYEISATGEENTRARRDS